MKLLSKGLRSESTIQVLIKLITDNEVNELSVMRSTARKLSTRVHKNSIESTVARPRKTLINFLNYQPFFLENKQNFSSKKVI